MRLWNLGETNSGARRSRLHGNEMETKAVQSDEAVQLPLSTVPCSEPVRGFLQHFQNRSRKHSWVFQFTDHFSPQWNKARLLFVVVCLHVLHFCLPFDQKYKPFVRVCQATESRKSTPHSSKPAKAPKKGSSRAKSVPTAADTFSPAATENLYYISHHAVDCLTFRGFGWSKGKNKKKKKGTKRKKKKITPI